MFQGDVADIDSKLCVKRMQPTIAAYFNSRKNEKDTRKQSYQEVSPGGEIKSRKAQCLSSSEKHVTHKTCIKLVGLVPTHSRNTKEEDRQNLLKMDKSLIIEDNESLSVLKRSSSSNKYSMCSPSKKVRSASHSSPSTSNLIDADIRNINRAKVRRFLFNEGVDIECPKSCAIRLLSPNTINQRSTLKNSSIYDKKTLDLLQECGVPIDELEAYSPSMYNSRLNSSTPKLIGQTENETFDYGPPSTTNAIEDKQQLNITGINSKSGDSNAVDLDATIPCDILQVPHLLPSIMIKPDLDYVHATLSTQTIMNSSNMKEQVVSEYNGTTIGFDPEKCDLEKLPVAGALLKAWQTVKASQILAPSLGDDKRLLEILFALEAACQNICMRLYMRQSKWQRQEKFLKEIGLNPNSAIKEAIDTLSALDYIQIDFACSEPLESVLNTLKVPELKSLIKKRFMKAKQTKPNMVAELKQFAATQPSVGPISTEDRLRLEAAAFLGPCLRLNDDMRHALFGLQLLYHFAVPDITSHYEFYSYMADIDAGRIILPQYQVHEVSAFENAETFDRYATSVEVFFNYCYHKERTAKKRTTAMLEIAKKAFQALKGLHQQPADKSPVSARFTAEYVYAKILTLAAADLTRYVDDAHGWLRWLTTHYRGVKRGEWYVRLAMHHHKHFKRYDLAVEVINQGLADANTTDAERFELTARARTLIKRKDVPHGLFALPDKALRNYNETVIKIKAKISTQLGHRIVYQEDEELFNVEEVALRYYAKRGYPKGVHCENALLMTLFTALFWDILYMDVSGEHPFISHLQYVPLDLYTKEFYLRRQPQIDQRLNDIVEVWEEEELFHRLHEFHILHSHKRSVHDARLSGDVVIEAVACIGRQKLGAMLTRLVKHLRQYRAGMPDLFVWNNDSKKCLFVEVKSAHDELSVKQKLWLESLHQIEVPVDVCRVYSNGEKIPKVRAKEF